MQDIKLQEISFHTRDQSDSYLTSVNKPLGYNVKYSPPLQPCGLQTASSSVDLIVFDSSTYEIIQDENKNSFNVDTLTGEIVQDKREYCPDTARLERFALQSAARRLLPDSGTAKCLRLRQFNIKDVGIYCSTKSKSVFYSGLQTCSIVWTCPVCAAKITEQRKIEIDLAIDKHQKNGGQVLLLTLTNPHTRTDNLPVLLKAQALAMSRFNSIKSAKALRASIGCIGTIKAYDITHGSNGWHPHFHILLFIRSSLDLEDIKSKFYKVWTDCCRLANLSIPSELHGVDLDDGINAAKYVCKGMYSLEMTKGHIKKAVKGRRSPFDLLRSYLYENDKQAGALFREFAVAFKGKQQLVWSDGLKDLFSIKKQADKKMKEKIDDGDVVLLGNLKLEEWKAVLHFNFSTELLVLTRQGNWESVRSVLDDLMSRER